jgi:predicted DNA-binding transcriptional regulator AlpA
LRIFKGSALPFNTIQNLALRNSRRPALACVFIQASDHLIGNIQYIKDKNMELRTYTGAKNRSAVLVAVTQAKPSMIFVGKEYAHLTDALRAPGRTIVTEDPRRNWLSHVNYASGRYTKFDEKNPRIQVSACITRNGTKMYVPQKYAPKPQTRQVEELKSCVSEVDHGTSPVLISIQKVIQLTGFQRSFLYAQQALGNFPLPIRFGTSRRAASRWVKTEILAWCQEQMDKRTPQNITL